MFRKVFYTGSNEKAAAYSGIRTKKVIFLTTTLCSALCGVAGIIYMARFGSAQPTFGIGMELNVIAAAVIGGASLSGGSGTIFGAILGTVLLSVVSSSLALLDVSVYWQDIIRGSILLAAVTIDHISTSVGAEGHDATGYGMAEKKEDFELIRQIHTVLVLHFIEGMKQSDIAQELNLSTSKVNRLITQGRNLGMVKIAIEGPFQRLVDLEQGLIEAARLDNAVVSPTVSGNPDTTLQQVGRAAANHLLETIRDGDVIAITGGKAVSAVVENLGRSAKSRSPSCR